MAKNRYYIKASFEVDAEIYDETKSLLTACRWLNHRNYKIGTVVMGIDSVVFKIRGGKTEAVAAQKYNDKLKAPKKEEPTNIVRPETFGAKGDKITDDTAAIQATVDECKRYNDARKKEEQNGQG